MKRSIVLILVYLRKVICENDNTSFNWAGPRPWSLLSSAYAVLKADANHHDDACRDADPLDADDGSETGQVGLIHLSPGLVVMVDDSCRKDVGSNPGAIYWMDIFSHWFVVRIVLIDWKDWK